MVTDPIADMLTRIRNAIRAKHKTVSIPHSKLKFEIARILMEEGYINNFEVKEERPPQILIQIKYSQNGKAVIYGIERVSRPGLRVYVGADEIPRVLGGLGTAIISTSKGLLSDREARKEKVGGEVLCRIY
jgi:small subunit ribosomal protein S8